MTVPEGLLVSRPKPNSTPIVRLWSRPKGFPMASAVCPTFRRESERERARESERGSEREGARERERASERERERERDREREERRRA